MMVWLYYSAASNQFVVLPNYEYQTVKDTIEQVLSISPVSELTGQEIPKRRCATYNKGK